MAFACQAIETHEYASSNTYVSGMEQEEESNYHADAKSKRNLGRDA
jgi:hypothetical protein